MISSMTSSMTSSIPTLSLASQSSQVLAEFPSVIHLNVGGRRLTSTLASLRSDPDSMPGSEG